MTHFLLFEADKVRSNFELELARREINWLVKNKLVHGTPAGNAQKGFSFVRAQVQLPMYSSLRTLIEEKREVPSPMRDSVERDKAVFFSVPLRSPIDLGSLQHRLSFSSRILVWDLKSQARFQELRCDGEFWNNPFSRMLLPPDIQSLKEKAVFNIAHPFDQGVTANVDHDILVNIESGEAVEGIDDNYSRMHIVSTFATLKSADFGSGENSGTSAIISRVSNWALPGTSMAGEDKTMGDPQARLLTGGLSAANVIYRLELKNETHISRKVSSMVISEIVKVNDLNRLGIHIYLEDPADGTLYLGFKKIPRDPKLDELGPDFDPLHEIRRLRQVEHIRNTHPGYKGPFGDGDIKIQLRSGWTVIIHRPGFKDCEDFLVRFETPEGREINPYLDDRPDFRKIFDEVRNHLLCQHNGNKWLRTVHELWSCPEDPRRMIEAAVDEFNRSRCDCVFEYDDEAFLWLLHLLFIEEDMNYRFWYHPPIRGLKRRKQGRDMPMNGILCLATELEDSERPRRIAQETREHGGLVPRPTSVGFNTPVYLEDTLKKILKTG